MNTNQFSSLATMSDTDATPPTSPQANRKRITPPVAKPVAKRQDPLPAKPAQRPLAPADNPLFKTTLCKHHAAGKCQRGEKCTFAHGEADLHRRRRVPRRPHQAQVVDYVNQALAAGPKKSQRQRKARPTKSQAESIAPVVAESIAPVAKAVVRSLNPSAPSFVYRPLNPLAEPFEPCGATVAMECAEFVLQ